MRSCLIGWSSHNSEVMEPRAAFKESLLPLQPHSDLRRSLPRHWELSSLFWIFGIALIRRPRSAVFPDHHHSLSFEPMNLYPHTQPFATSAWAPSVLSLPYYLHVFLLSSHFVGPLNPSRPHRHTRPYPRSLDLPGNTLGSLDLPGWLQTSQPRTLQTNLNLEDLIKSLKPQGIGQAYLLYSLLPHLVNSSSPNLSFNNILSINRNKPLFLSVSLCT